VSSQSVIDALVTAMFVCKIFFCEIVWLVYIKSYLHSFTFYPIIFFRFFAKLCFFFFLRLFDWCILNSIYILLLLSNHVLCLFKKASVNPGHWFSTLGVTKLGLWRNPNMCLKLIFFLGFDGRLLIEGINANSVIYFSIGVLLCFTEVLKIPMYMVDVSNLFRYICFCVLEVICLILLVRTYVYLYICTCT